MLAETLKSIFQDNFMLCENIGTSEIQQLARLSFKYKTVAPNFLQVLKTLIQTDSSGGRINTRIQYIFAKMGMDFRAQQGFRILHMSSAEKHDVLMGKYGSDLLTYFVNMTHSFCSAVFSLKEVFGILIHPNICGNIKRPFLKLLNWAFLTQRPHLIHSRSFKSFMDLISNDLDRIHQYVSQYSVPEVNTFDDWFLPAEDTDMSTIIASDIYYLIDAVLPFLNTLSGMFTSSVRDNAKFREIYKHVVGTIMELFPLIVPHLTNRNFLSIITDCLRALMTSCYCGEQAISNLINSMEDNFGRCSLIKQEDQQHCRAFLSPEYTITSMSNVAGIIDRTSITNQMLAHGALQILRAMLHNIIIILPEDILTSKRKKKKYRIRLQQLQELQDLYVSQGLVHLVMTLIGTQNQAIFRESLALLECMLFGTGKSVQNAALDFFEGSKEEALFMIISDFLKYSAELMKESFVVMRKVIICEDMPCYAMQYSNGFFAKLSLKSSQKMVRVGVADTSHDIKSLESKAKHTKQVVAKLADGYHLGLQIIDCVNYILKQSSWDGCSSRSVLNLKKGVSKLLMSLIEENSPSALKVAMVDNQWLKEIDDHKTVINHYKSRVYSIEIVKDGYLQKVYFPFEKAIRDFMTWANVIIKDYYHQENILTTFIGRLVVRQRLAWDYLMVLLSYLINLYMLVCWIGKDPDGAQNVNRLSTVTSPIIRFDLSYLNHILLACKVIHNIVSLMLLCSYFLAQHPSLPRCCSRSKKEDTTFSVDMEGPESKTHNYNTKLFSAKTGYYFVIAIMSIVGTAVTPYCFAFHLLHIVEVNTLLQGVIRAITKNGKSLLWVAILGFCVLYIYGLIGFAFFRHVFEPTNQLYCKTLYECTATVSTYGLIGLMGERRRGLFEFFPVNRALSLRILEQNKEDILDELKRDIGFLKQRQQQMDIERHLLEQDNKQRQWHHRLMSQLSRNSGTDSLTHKAPELSGIREETNLDPSTKK
ncbi:hypothetical protein LSH36_220g02042 [Paralvinella palmiformis]|uniref:Uncharacterized protein n=1 Tax=Paralvinella palmiformis TaxID=53620 RepID=A0AAD9JMW1_9ANNE|nr:hypothetical protein LSH36_220g02042 [Paralvinella palmiformis]